MVSRRQLLARGARLVTLPLLARAALALAPASPPLYKVIIDRRFAASRAFGRAAAFAGVPVHAMSGDVTQVWYHDLGPTWRRSPLPVAGLTAEGAIFCLERLAWDAGMRVAFRGVHTLAAGQWTHELEGPQPLIAALREEWPSGGDWAYGLSRFTAQCTAAPRGARARSSCASTARAGEPPAADPSADWPLISWVIAPQRRAVAAVRA